MGVKELAKILISKLTKEELNKLCTFYDDGSIDELFNDFLVEQDAINFPGDYIK